MVEVVMKNLQPPPQKKSTKCSAVINFRSTSKTAGERQKAETTEMEKEKETSEELYCSASLLKGSLVPFNQGQMISFSALECVRTNTVIKSLCGLRLL